MKTSDYVKWTVAMLRGELSRRGLSKVGKKNDMIRTLIDDDEKQLLDDGDEKSKKILWWSGEKLAVGWGRREFSAKKRPTSCCYGFQIMSKKFRRPVISVHVYDCCGNVDVCSHTSTADVLRVQFCMDDVLVST